MGLWSYAEGRLSRFGRQHGLTSEAIACLRVDADQTLWVGTKDSGLFCHRAGRFVPLGSSNDLLAGGVLCLAEDNAGHFWMGTDKGLVRVSRARLGLFLDGRLPSVQGLQLDWTDGLQSLEFEGPNQPNVCRMPDGRLWFATAAGLAVVNPSEVHMNRLEPPALRRVGAARSAGVEPGAD